MVGHHVSRVGSSLLKVAQGSTGELWEAPDTEGGFLAEVHLGLQCADPQLKEQARASWWKSNMKVLLLAYC